MNCPTPPFSWSSNSHITQEQECAAVQGWVHLKCSWGRHIIPGTFTDNVPSYTECHACHRASKQSKKDKRKQIIMWQKERTLRIYRAILAGLSALPRAPEQCCAQAAPEARQGSTDCRLSPSDTCQGVSWAHCSIPELPLPQHSGQAVSPLSTSSTTAPWKSFCNAL